MSYNRGLSEPLLGYVPWAGLLRSSRLRQDRPLSDGDIWAFNLPPVTSTPYRNITDHSCLKVYHKDPAQAFSHGPRPANGDARVSTQHRYKHGSENYCLVNGSSWKTTSSVAERIVSPASNSCHFHILFAVEGRNVPLPLICLVGVLYCSPRGLRLGLACVLWCSLLRDNWTCISGLFSLFILPPISSLISFSCSDSSMFVSRGCNETKAVSSNAPPQIHLSNPPDPLSNPPLLSARRRFPGGVAAPLWYCRNYINLSYNPTATCCTCHISIKWNW